MYFIEMLWKCRHCGHTGSGARGEDEGLRCSQCGSQKADEAWIMPGDTSRAAAVEDPELLRRAKAGPNWTCAFCRHEERQLHDECSVCGAIRPNRAVILPKKKPQDDELPAGIDSTMRPPAPPNILRCVLPYESPLPLPELAKSISPRPNFWPIGIGIAAAMLLGWLLYWLLSNHETVASVTAVQWERALVLEERRILDGSGWRDQMPLDATDVSCLRTLRGHERCRPHDCNPHQVSYECNCTGGGTYSCNCRMVCTPQNNGFASCSEQCSTCTHPRVCSTCTRTEYDTCYDQCPVYDDMCSYRYPQWDAIDHRKLSGSTNEAKWPERWDLKPEQRIQERDSYSVNFTDGERQWTERPNSDVFSTRQIGTRYRVSWNRGGGFQVLGPAQ